MAVLQRILRAFEGERVVDVHLALAAPALAALALARSPLFVALVVFAAAVLLVVSGSAYTLRGGSLGVAISIAAVHGASTGVVVIAIAGIASAGLAAASVERVLRAVPRRGFDAVLCGLALAGMARIASAPGASSAAPMTKAIIGDALALALVLSYEAGPSARTREQSVVAHLTAASASLPLSAARRLRPGISIAALSALTVAACLLVPPLRATIVVAGVGVVVAHTLATHAPDLGARGVVVALATTLVSLAERPAVTLVFALVAAVAAFAPTFPTPSTDSPET